MHYKIIVGLILAGLLIQILADISLIKSHMARINLTVNKISKQVGVPDTIEDEIKSLLLEEKRIEAVKRYRMVTGIGLVEAKKYVDSLNEQEKAK